jgi:antitoxin (DNA-binding transcriptional repressor) of toxin-antitoxin stability system
MKVITIAEAEGQLSQIIHAVSQGESIILKDGDREVCLSPHEPGELNLDEDSPELEAELLKSANQVPEPFSIEELRAIGQRVLRRRGQE